MTGSLLKSYAGQVKIFLLLLVLFLAVAIYFNFHLLIIARNAIQAEVERRLAVEADLVLAELQRDQMMRGLSRDQGALPYIPPTYLDRFARLQRMVSVEILALDGRVISSSDPERVGIADQLISPDDSAARRRLVAGGAVVPPMRRRPGTRYATMAAYRPIQDRSRRAIAFIRVEQEVPLLASVDFDLRVIATLQAGGLVFVLVLVIFFARWLLTPYRRLQRAAGEAPGVVEGLSAGGGDEADQLVEAFRGVIGKLREQEDELQALKRSADRSTGGALGPGEALIAGMSSAVLVIDGGGRLSGMNAAAERLLEVPRLAAVGRDYGRLLRGNARLVELISDGLASGQGRSREVVPFVHDSGRTSHLGVMTSPIRPESGASTEESDDPIGVLCLLTDLTEIKVLRERVGMKENLAALGEMSAGIAHEFRNSLAAIQGYARLLSRDRAVSARTTSREHAEAILREVVGIRRVIDDFLRYARPQKLALDTVDVNRMLDDVVSDFRADQLAEQIAIVVEGRVAAIVADETLLRRAILNLLRNAAEALPGEALVASGGGGSASLPVARRIVITCRNDEGGRGGVRISVSDNGAGIPDSAREHLFTPFFSTKDGGTGLGLALVHKVIVLHDGQIEVDSSPGHGATMTLVLPARPGDAAAEAALS